MKHIFLFTFIILLICAISQIASASSLPLIPTGNGKITLYSPDRNDSETFVYRNADGKLNENGISGIARFFRCKLTGKVYDIDIKLIEMIDAIEDHFGERTVRLICGYRSPERNALMRKQGRGVAKNSLHIRGMAADIEIAGVAPEKLRNFAYSLQGGGVGYYGRRSFVHVDTGRIRTWGWRPPVGSVLMAVDK